MKLRALCFFVLLAGCSTETSATGPERAFLEVVARKDDACVPAPGMSDVKDCSVYVVLNDRSMGRLVQIRGGIPYVEPSIDEEPERYALWLGRMTTFGLRVEQYVGPRDRGYDEAFYNFLGQDASVNETST